ncbi:MAG: DUF5309 domain-containing protein [Actinobacteria bacterium]|nr:DUF5309 domain-containing protein [Actinomycetota bacterium]
MPNVAGGATVWNAPNYVGQLYTIGANQTPFLNMIGGLSGGGKQVNSWEFAVDQTDVLEAASQPAITETDSLTAPTPTTYVRGQDKNVCQIFHRAVQVSYAKQSNYATLAGLALIGPDQQPVTNEKDYQIARNLRQISVDVEYTFLNGAYNLAVSAATANKMRGIIAAISTNAIAAGGAAISKSLLNQLFKAMADSGAKMQDCVIFANSFVKQGISNAYGYAPEDRNVGGVNVKQIETDFCMCGIVWAPKMPTGSLICAEMSEITPVFLSVPEKGYLFYEELSKTGAAERGQLYGQIGLAYGPEQYHGKITSLATS